jgi:RNA polymerase sigma factor (sigma-70 family)
LPLVWWFIKNRLIKKNKIRPEEIDECVGYLMWSLCMAAESFKPNFGTKFSTYALYGFHSGLCAYLKQRNIFEKHFVLTDFTIRQGGISTDNKDRIIEPEYIPKNNKTVKWEDLKVLFDYIEMIPIEEQIIFFYYEQKCSFDKIGEMMNLSGERIRQIHGDIVNKLSEAVKNIDIRMEDFLINDEVKNGVW